MGSNYGDLDNNGYLDIYVGTGEPNYERVIPNKFYLNKSGYSFLDKTTKYGLGHLQKGHGISFADLDNDGDQDIYAVMGGAYTGDFYPNALFENPGFENNFVYLSFQGVQTNRLGYGVRVAIQVKENGRTRSIHREVGPGGSFGNNPSRLEIGLGNATSIEKLEVFWPVSNHTMEIQEIELNNHYRIIEGNPNAEKLNLKKIKWNRSNGHAHHNHDH
jgi:hypothetical protein